MEYSEELDLINVWDEGLWGLPVFENDLNANLIHLLWDHSEDGDNGLDGKLSEDDVSALRNYLVKNEVEIDTAAADVNSDGKLNGKDVVLLGRLVRGE